MKLSGSMFYYGAFVSLAAMLSICNVIVLPLSLQMVAYTASIIYLGSHLSLKQLQIDPASGEPSQAHQTLTNKDAIMFPVCASAVLLTWYNFNSKQLNMLGLLYMTAVGVFLMTETLTSLVDHCTSETYSVGLDIGIDLSINRVATFLFSCVIAILWLTTRNWVFHNMFAISMSTQAIATISAGSFKIVSLLLVLLFFYDIFFVFGTTVMVKIATGFEGPIKILLPRATGFSILGLGDIVFPGILIAMALRFDYYLHQEFLDSHSKAPEQSELKDKDKSKEGWEVAGSVDSAKEGQYDEVDMHERFPKAYFWSNMGAYQIALVVTQIVMFTFNAAQPALLYLVPACLGALQLTSVYMGQYKKMMEYDEGKIKEEQEQQAAEYGEGKIKEEQQAAK